LDKYKVVQLYLLFLSVIIIIFNIGVTPLLTYHAQAQELDNVFRSHVLRGLEQDTVGLFPSPILVLNAVGFIMTQLILSLFLLYFFEFV